MRLVTLKWFSSQPAPLYQSALTAAKWWGDCLRDGQNHFDAHDNSRAGGLAAIMAAQSHHAARDVDTLAESISAFEHHLATLISAELRRLEKLGRKYQGKCESIKWVSTVTFGVDYAATDMLRDALMAADLWDQQTSLPTQSVMHVTTVAVSVMPGYQAPFVDVPVPESVPTAP
jgi:hypothetical protein